MTLTLGNDPNCLKLIVRSPKIKPYSFMRGGMIEDGILIELPRYNIENALCQMLDDYGEDELINKIKALR